MTRILILVMMLTLGLGLLAHADYKTVTGPCGLEFPEDHGPHPDYRTEWWYWTGNLASLSGHRFGFQLTFFRSRITAPGSKSPESEPRSAWRADQIYMAHAALTDISGKHYFFKEAMVRQALNMAGAMRTSDGVRVFLKNWFAQIGTDGHHLRADTDDFAIELDLTPKKPIVLHGDDGYSRKGEAPERASCYYSFTRLEAQGKVRVGKTWIPVTGASWMDQEFSTALLEPGLSGWDWFSLQLSDNTELMLFMLRKTAGGVNNASSGSYIPSSGKPVKITKQQFVIRTAKRWKSPRSGAVYPSGWFLTIPSLNMELTITPNLADQETTSGQGAGMVYWEGSVSVEGQKNGKPVSGQGYVELTGYDKPFDAPL